jgi:hypothetical protein
MPYSSYEGYYESNASNYILRMCDFNNNEIYVNYAYVLCNYEAIFPQSVHHFRHNLTNVE